MPHAELLILSGDADDWTPAHMCKSLVENVTKTGSEFAVEIVVSPNATHGYDIPEPPRRYMGHTLEYNYKATQRS